VGAPGEAGAIQPVKVRPGSECCMAEGDDRDEAYTATCEGYGNKPRNDRRCRGRGCLRSRRQHVRCRYARRCRPAGVYSHITHRRIASEPGRPHGARDATAFSGHDRKSRRRSCRGSHEESDGCIVPLKPRTTPISDRGRRVWREGGRSGGRRTATHVPDSAPEPACHWSC